MRCEAFLANTNQIGEAKNSIAFGEFLGRRKAVSKPPLPGVANASDDLSEAER